MKIGRWYYVRFADHFGRVNQDPKQPFDEAPVELLGRYIGDKRIGGRMYHLFVHVWASDDPDVTSFTAVLEGSIIEQKGLRE